MQFQTSETAPVDAPVAHIDPELHRFLESWLDVARPQLPRPPAAAMEIITVSRRPDASIDDIARLLGREPMLAGETFKMANSALYRGAANATTLKQALVRVGLSNVRDLVWDVALRMTVIRAPAFGEILERVRRHSTAVAWVSRIVARNTSVPAEDSFLVGLMHDVGLSVGLVALCEYLEDRDEVLDLTPERWEAVLSVHAALGSALTRRWGVPEAVANVVANHEPGQGELLPSVAVLAIAEAVANDGSWGAGPDVPPDALMRSLTTLSLTDRHLQIIAEDSKPVFATLAQQFGH